ncbi:MAG TPA: DUF3500 domain-containing protein [Planctomycetota bacterium]|nr:DUF3500 domain-containing protein [Planctomycetota bacterium]
MADHLTTSNECPDCAPLSRRGFVKTTAAALAALTAAGGAARSLLADEKKPASETLVAQLHSSLTEQQRKAICFDFDHPLRSRVENNWNIVKPTISDFFTKDQQALIKDIFMSLHSDEYAQRVLHQVEHDSSDIGGFGACSVALFGEPGPDKKFEFVFTGRHVTRRCDGNSVEGAAFGGPIFYGHAAKSFNEKPDHPENVYWYQGLRANEVFKALNGKQREMSLRTDSRPERGTDTVKLAGKGGAMHGVPMTELSADQKDLVRKVMSDVLAPFRKVDADEAMKFIEADGGFDQLHMAFYKNMDIGNDGVWDVWQIEGPSMVWYFRGAPHVHTWVNIRARS